MAISIDIAETANTQKRNWADYVETSQLFALTSLNLTNSNTIP